MTEQQIAQKVLEKFVACAKRGMSVKESFQEVFGVETWEVFVGELYEELRAIGFKESK